MNVAINGNAPSSISGIVIDNDGYVYATYENGSRVPAYRIPLATVPSPDNLQPVPGDAFAITTSSGDIQIGFPTEGGRGSLVSGRARTVERRHGLRAHRHDRGAARLHGQFQGRPDELGASRRPDEPEALIGCGTSLTGHEAAAMSLAVALNTARSSLLTTAAQIAVSGSNIADADDPTRSRNIAPADDQRRRRRRW